jgi:ABC transport system ATP-binding/permease protein
MSSLIQAVNVSKRYGERLLFEGIDINISEGSKTALIAKNGSGKSSLLNIIAGDDTADSGSVTKVRGLKTAYLRQEIDHNPDKTVLETVFYSDSEVVNAIKDYNNILGTDNQILLQKAIDKMDSLNAWDFENRAKQILSKLEITDFQKKNNELSGGQQKRVALASVLICEPDLIILDEPTNHLDLGMIEWLEEYLSGTGQSVFMVTHDRYFLESVCDTIIEMDKGEVFVYKGNYSYYLEKRAERIDNLEAGVAKAKNLMKTELDWLRRMPKARTGKSKYRVNKFDSIKSQANKNIYDNKLELDLKAERLGKKIAELDKISKSFDDKKIIDNFSYKFMPYEKLGIVGKNGTGKTSFLNILTGLLIPDSGKTEIGSTVKFAYYRQDGIDFDEDAKPIDIISSISENIKLGNGKSLSASGFLNYFLFTPEQQHTLVRKLSGGEKRRLYLCKILINQPNFIILDEPTNDLDIVTLQVLEDYLRNISACVIVVSHDRYFMDRLVDHLLVFEDRGKIIDFPGNYTQYRNSELYKKNVNDVSKENSEFKEKSAPQNTSKKKQTYAERLESENIENDLAILEKKKTELEELMNEGRLDSEELVDKSRLYSELCKKIAEKESRWLEIND